MADQSDDGQQIPLLPGEHPPTPGAVKVEVLDDGTQHHHSAQTKARKAALDVLYQSELRGMDPQDALASLGVGVRTYTWQIVDGVESFGDDIDTRIEDAVAGDWTLDRMPGIDRALARIATWEIVYTALSPSTAIAEAVALADEYSTDESASFLNGLLARVAQVAADDSAAMKRILA
ncbi:MAG: transcription antitermination factor NusB [Propionibacteriaceae bacterium]|nr:transcription antitermination factor NusB [Propionibacteriaceae bacterium]